MSLRLITLLVNVFLLTGVSGSVAAQAAGPDSPAKSTAGAGGLPATAAPDFNGAKGWLNVSKPLSIKDLRGKVVLLDFWTFCCINCMHVIPKLKELEKKYPDQLVVVGVHSGKFSNEKNLETIGKAVARYKIEHPVVNDQDYKIWDAYAVTAWPTYVLIDASGNIQGQFRGEAGVAELTPRISSLIAAAKANKTLKPAPLKVALESAKLTASPLLFPGKVIVDKKTNRLIISDSGHNRVLVADLNGNVATAIGGPASGFVDGKFNVAKFNSPQGLALNGDDLYIADTDNHAIRLVNLKLQTVRTVAGTGRQGDARTDGDGKTTMLNSPWDICWNKDQLYIAMAGFHQIWCYAPTTGKVTVVAGSGRESIRNGDAQRSAFAQPSGLSTDGKTLFVADSEGSAIRTVDLMSGGVSSLIGKGLFTFGDVDGKLAEARLQHPLGVLWNEDKLYVADSYNHKVKVVDLADKTIKTLAGDGKPGLQDGLKGRLSEPAGLGLSAPKLFVADTNNHAIRVVDTKNGSVSTLNLRFAK